MGKEEGIGSVVYDLVILIKLITLITLITLKTLLTLLPVLPLLPLLFLQQGGFIMEAGDLAFSVVLFSVLAATLLVLLVVK